MIVVVGEAQERHGRDLVLDEPVRVDPTGRRARYELLPFEQTERAGRFRGTVEQPLRRCEDVQLLAEGDAVEVHHSGDLFELAPELRFVQVVVRAGELDLLRGKRNQADAALEVRPASAAPIRRTPSTPEALSIAPGPRHTES